MRENSLMALALLGVIIGASGLGFGAYSTMQVQTGALKGDDGDDGDDGKNGIDAPVKGIIVQVVSNSTSEADNTIYTSPHTLLTINFSISANSDIFCDAIIIVQFGYPSSPGSGVNIRLWLDDTTQIVNISLYHGPNDYSQECCSIEGFFADLSEGFHTIELQYWRSNSFPPDIIWVNRWNSYSVLTVMEIAQ